MEQTFATGDGRTISIQDMVNLYRDVVSRSKPSSGTIKPIEGSRSYILTAQYDTLDCDQLEIVKCSKDYLLTVEDGHSLKVRRLVKTNGLVDMESHSKSGRHLARLNLDKKQILQIWTRSRLLKSIDVTDSESHGLINTDSVFSSFQWSKFDENKLLYVCQRKKPKHQSYFKQDSSKELDNLGLKHSHSENWGECLVDIDHTMIAMLDVDLGCKITTLDMEGHSLGDTQWLNNHQTVSVAYPEGPRRLGLIYHNSRPSFLVVHDWSTSPPKEVHRIQHDSLSLTNPRVCQKGGRFVYLAAPTYGAHVHAQQIYLSDMHNERLLAGFEGHTLFVKHLPKNCFLCDDRYIVIVRSTEIYKHLCFYDLEKSEIFSSNFPSSSMEILDVYEDFVFASGSGINSYPSLYVARVSADKLDHPLDWQGVDVADKLTDVSFEPFKIPTPDDSSFISGFLVSPVLTKNIAGQSDNLLDDEKNLPTVVLLHGGPHAAVDLDYLPAFIIYARLGLRTLCINYRGSTGVDEDYVNSLVGRVGELDVSDCLLAIRHFVTSGLINPKKLIIQGGSHGGFLAAHLSCQTEFKFTSAILRNPVIDLTSLHITSDIPDWCYTEGLGTKNYDPTFFPSVEELSKMFKCSPISRFRDACAPTLMLLGNQDKRVPMFQGERWYQLLKARGVKTKCKVYDDKHDLAKPEAATDGTITAIIWILTNLGESQAS